MNQLTSRISRDPMVITQSDLTGFTACRRAWMLGTYFGLREKEPKAFGPLTLGTRVHEALDAYYGDGRDPVEAYMEIVASERLTLDESGVVYGRDDWEREAELGRIMLEGYVEWLADTGADADWEVIGAEQRLSARLMDGHVELRGKVDLRVRLKSSGARVVVDHKPQPDDEEVLTPNGWARMGDLAVGDEVIGSDWSAVTITDIKIRGLDDVYRVTFDDGTSVEATGDHPWVVLDSRRTEGTRLVETLQLTPTGKKSGRQSTSSGGSIVAVRPDFSSTESKLPVHPYVMGFFLGNGHGNLVCDGERATVSAVADIEGQTVHATTATSRRKSLFSTRLSPETSATLAAYDMKAARAWEKEIPEIYMMASAKDRLLLLQGLMDADGHQAAGKKRITMFATTSPMMAEQVALLVRSLGGWAKVMDWTPGTVALPKGKSYSVRDATWVKIRMRHNPFLHSKHRQRHDDMRPWEDTNKRVVSVEHVGQKNCRCFVLDADDHLYVTRGGTLTHNTTAHFSNIAVLAPYAPQLPTYMLLERINYPNSQDEWLQGAVYNMLRKVKRTVNSKPPFYDRITVMHNDEFMRHFWTRINGLVRDYVDVVHALDRGVDHRMVAYPTAGSQCRYCPFKFVCLAADDGSRVGDMIDDLFVQSDPHARYSQEQSSLIPDSATR